MSQRAHPTAIGAFVLGALALLVAGLLVFGSGEFFKRKFRYVMYFGGSVSGLAEGAPVEFRGVKVGSVQRVSARIDPDDLVVHIPVEVEFVAGNMRHLRDERDPETNIDRLVESGMRAQLQVQSLLTGQQMISLDIYPDADPAEVEVDPRTGLPRIPTVPTTIQEFAQTARAVMDELERVPFDALFADLQSTLAGIEELVNSPELRQAFVNANRTMEGAQEALAQAEETLVQARETLAVADEDSPVRYELLVALREISEASRAVRDLADYLERHPEALVRGKAADR